MQVRQACVEQGASHLQSTHISNHLYIPMYIYLTIYTSVCSPQPLPPASRHGVSLGHHGHHGHEAAQLKHVLEVDGPQPGRVGAREGSSADGTAGRVEGSRQQGKRAAWKRAGWQWPRRHRPSHVRSRPRGARTRACTGAVAHTHTHTRMHRRAPAPVRRDAEDAQVHARVLDLRQVLLAVARLLQLQPPGSQRRSAPDLRLARRRKWASQACGCRVWRMRGIAEPVLSVVIAEGLQRSTAACANMHSPRRRARARVSVLASVRVCQRVRVCVWGVSAGSQRERLATGCPRV
jgi:hypothetical protein